MNRWDLLTLGLVEQLFQSSSSTRNIDRTFLQVGLFPRSDIFLSRAFPKDILMGIRSRRSTAFDFRTLPYYVTIIGLECGLE